MPLSPLDDLLAHQTPDTFDHVYTGDRNFYDRYYFNLSNSNIEIWYPNTGFVCVYFSLMIRWIILRIKNKY